MTLHATESLRLDKFLAQQMPEHSRTRLARLIEEGGVTVNGEPAKPGLMLKVGDEVWVDEPEPTPAHDLTPSHEAIPVLFEDEHLMVVNKPRGMATHPAPGLKESTLVNALLGRGQGLSPGSEEFRPGIVHRLDKETTGVLLVAKTEAAHRHLATQIASRSAERRYVAIASGRFENPRLRIEAPIGRDPSDRRKMMVRTDGKPAITHVRVLAELDAGSLVVAKLETGRTHQIRVHLAATGHPLVGDRIYAKGVLGEGALQLHAAYIAFDHPVTQIRMSYFCPPPEDFLARERIVEDVVTESS